MATNRLNKESLSIVDLPKDVLASSSGLNLSNNDRNWSLRLKVHDRLFFHHTFNSIRRNCRFSNAKMTSSDSLDLALSSIYVHSMDYNVPKCYVPMQPKTLNITAWDPHEHFDISEALFNPKKSKNKDKKQDHSMRRIISGPKISIATAKGVTTQSRHDNKSSEKRYENYIINKKYPKSAKSTGRDQLSLGKKHTSGQRSVKSTSMLRGKAHGVAYEKSLDDVLDKTQRRETYAAQMRAIERIHPSSLKLAVDGPHSDQTNPGYSRKIDGTFYGI